ncbi:hypothetical protein I4F81_010748 [Pyropia yezoensis]|uniref:Uncharacterized protein n=1 Tax=Pyropia yezoensis TaxID=2788 RepID=A0ACC3CDU3_PYRYE|nr:hypothetical protein I4F81_010748 [Neopyropia yezoensis]
MQYGRGKAKRKTGRNCEWGGGGRGMQTVAAPRAEAARPSPSLALRPPIATAGAPAKVPEAGYIPPATPAAGKVNGSPPPCGVLADHPPHDRVAEGGKRTRRLPKVPRPRHQPQLHAAAAHPPSPRTTVTPSPTSTLTATAAAATTVDGDAVAAAPGRSSGDAAKVRGGGKHVGVPPHKQGPAGKPRRGGHAEQPRGTGPHRRGHNHHRQRRVRRRHRRCRP